MYIYEEVITENIRPIDLAIKVTIFTSLYSLTVFKKYILHTFFYVIWKSIKHIIFMKMLDPSKKKDKIPYKYYMYVQIRLLILSILLQIVFLLIYTCFV